MASYLVYFLLFFLFLIVIPVGISPFETPKVVLAEIVIDLILLIKIINFKKKPLKNLINTQIIFTALLFILSLDQRFLFNPAGSFFGNEFRLQGVFLFWHLLLFSIISKSILIDQRIKSLIPLSFICLVIATIILGVNNNNRAFATLGEPNALATTAVFFFPFVFFNYSNRVKIISFITTLAVILLSGSRAGLTALMIEVFFLLLISKFKFSIKKAVLISFCLIALTCLLPFIQNYSWFENRGLVWQTAFQAGFKSPILGQGFGNIQNSIHGTAVKLGNTVAYQVVDSSHNFLLDFWIQGGLVGLICILCLIGLAIYNFSVHKKTLELTAFLGLITAMLFNPVSVVNLLAFWWLIGQGF